MFRVEEILENFEHQTNLGVGNTCNNNWTRFYDMGPWKMNKSAKVLKVEKVFFHFAGKHEQMSTWPNQVIKIKSKSRFF